MLPLIFEGHIIASSPLVSARFCSNSSKATALYVHRWKNRQPVVLFAGHSGVAVKIPIRQCWREIILSTVLHLFCPFLDHLATGAESTD